MIVFFTYKIPIFQGGASLIKNASCHARQQQKICYLACLWCLKHETYANRLAITISKQHLRISWCHESKTPRLSVSKKRTHFDMKNSEYLSNEKVHREFSMKNWEQSYESHARPLSAVGGFHYIHTKLLSFEANLQTDSATPILICISYVLVVSGKQRRQTPKLWNYWWLSCHCPPRFW